MKTAWVPGSANGQETAGKQARAVPKDVRFHPKENRQGLTNGRKLQHRNHGVRLRQSGAFHLAALRQSQIVSRRVMIRLLHSGLIHGGGVCQIGVGRRLLLLRLNQAVRAGMEAKTRPVSTGSMQQNAIAGPHLFLLAKLRHPSPTSRSRKPPIVSKTVRSRAA